MNLFPDDQPWNLYRLSDGRSELLDAHNDVIATLDANFSAERVIVNAPEMADFIRGFVTRIEILEAEGTPHPQYPPELVQTARDLLRRIEEETE